MRILGFSKIWPKLDQDEFTTFRFKRGDKDWEVGEKVQCVFRPRSKHRRLLCHAEIIAKESRDCSRYQTLTEYKPLSIPEAIADGFRSISEMISWINDTHDGRHCEEPMNKLTLRKL